MKTSLVKYQPSFLAASISLCFGLSVTQVASQEIPAEKEIEVMTVTGRAAQFYFVDQSSMATKTLTDYMDIAQSIQVLTNELISDQAARQTTDLYRSISGVTQFSYSGITARGFRQDQVRYDGVQGDPYSGFSIPQLFNVEQIEVLKGPSGMLYGSGEPGGLINYVTKKPKFDKRMEAAVFAGNYDLRGIFVDKTGSVDQSGTVAYRIGGFYQDRETFRNNTQEENLLLSGGVTWLINDQIDLTLQYDYIDQDLGGHRLRGVPVDDDGNFLTDISYNPNEKTDFQKVQGNVLQAIMNTEISASLTNRSVIRYLDNERTQNYHENRGLADDGRTMTREFRDQLRENEELSFTTDFVWETDLGGIEHTLLFGADHFDVSTHFEYKVGRGAPSLIPDIDILNPVYGADPSTYLLQTRPDVETKFERTGFYIQDQVRFNDHWLGIIGGRYDRFKDELLSNNFQQNDNSFTPRIGVIFQPNIDMSIFANITDGFKPQSTGNQIGAEGDTDGAGTLIPEESRQLELGIKNLWLNNQISSTATVYQIKKDNVVIGNPLDTGIDDGQAAVLQIGEVTSEGFELDLVGDILKNWTGTLSYAYNNTKITGGSPDSIRNSIGSEFVNAPDHTLGIWTRYDFPDINSAFAIGIDYVSDRISFNGQTVKSYAIWDASWQSHINGYELQINVKNLFDKEYASSGFNRRNGHFPGEPRTLLVQLSKTF